jgi:hypothetical protein
LRRRTGREVSTVGRCTARGAAPLTGRQDACPTTGRNRDDAQLFMTLCIVNRFIVGGALGCLPMRQSSAARLLISISVASVSSCFSVFLQEVTELTEKNQTSPGGGIGVARADRLR